MEIKIAREKKYSIIVNEEELKSLISFLDSQYTQIEIVAKCNDGSTLTTSKIEDVINFENSKYRKIEVIEISFGKPYSQGGNIEFNGKYRFLRTCSFTVKDNDDAKALKVSKEIETRFDECKTWYSLITKFPPSISISIIYLMIWIPNLWIKVFSNTYKSSPNFSIIDLVNIIGILSPAFLLYVVSINYLDKVWAWLFPRVWFDIGKQKVAFQKRAKIRSWVFGGVILALIIGVLASVIATLITNQWTR